MKRRMWRLNRCSSDSRERVHSSIPRASQVSSFRKFHLTYLKHGITYLLLTSLLGCWSSKLNYRPRNGADVDLTKLPIEDLVEVPYVHLFKKATPLFKTPAAAYVITPEDIANSGDTNIPGAIRTVPGMQVAQHTASSWSVSLRGFSGLSRGIGGQFANKLLVLRDGRSVYTPLFSGVIWDTQDILLEDLQSLEIIRGPGASIWGANAVNGIINMTSKYAWDTQGVLMTFGMGTEQRGFGHVRFGGQLGERHYYRVYAKFQRVDNFVNEAGEESGDGWDILRAGFRVDSNISNGRFTLLGEVYDGDVGQRYRAVTSPDPPFQEKFDFESNTSGANLLASWHKRLGVGSELMLKTYYDRTHREEAVVIGTIDTYDFEFHHRFRAGNRNDMIWGGGYRFIHDSFDSTFAFSLSPDSRGTHLIHAFVQNDIGLITDRLYLTLGSKFEHNDYTGFEIQPTARLLWTPNDRNTVWSAVSRAVRTPSRSEIDARVVLRPQTTTTPTAFEVIFGNPDFTSENLTAFELGYRVRPRESFELDIASFYNVYTNLRTNEPGSVFIEPTPAPMHFVIPFIAGNQMSGYTYGLELAANLNLRAGLQLRAAYSFLKMNLERDEQSQDTAADIVEGQSPNHQLIIGSVVDLKDDLNLSMQWRYVDGLPAQGVSSYVNLDARLAWQLMENLEVALVGQNLLHNQFAENSSVLTVENAQIMTLTESSQVQRGLYTKLTWQF